MSEWENSEDEDSVPPPKTLPVKSKFEGEDEEEQVASDWEDSSDDDKPKAPVSNAAPPKKKGTLKQKLAQKEAEKEARRANGELDEDEEIEMHPRERARLMKERELQADLKNAEDLLGGASISRPSGSTALDQLLKFNPKTKEDFQELSSLIISHIVKRHENKPLYHFFVEHHSRELALPLKDVEVRKVASGLTTLANEKQKEQKDKASGKKKPKTTTKTLGAAKTIGKIDTNAYDEALDDFGNDPDDFM